MTRFFTSTVALMMTIILALTSGTVFGQATDTSSEKLIGKWMLVKYTMPDTNGKPINRLALGETTIYEFSKDGTYKVTYKDKTAMAVNKGKWKIIDKEKKIHLYNNIVVSPDNKVIIPEFDDKPIIKLTATELVIQENRFDEILIGTSYYEKQ